MKTFKILVLLMILFLATSCLKGGLEELPEYDVADITGVSGVLYRYISDELAPETDEALVKNVDLNHTTEIDTETNTVLIKVAAKAAFPQDQLANLSRSKLVVMIGISTAARVFSTNGAPALGVPGDWSKPNVYDIVAANGEKKTWTIEVIELKK